MNQSLALVAVLTLTVSTTGLLQVGIVNANYYPPPSIEIFSPIPSPDIHSTASIPLQIRVNVLTNQADITFIRYSLDRATNITLTDLTRENGLYYWTTTEGVFAHGNAFHTEASLEDVAEGNHTLNVYAHAADGKEMSRTRDFRVDYDYVPPQNPWGSSNSFPNGTLPFSTLQPPEGSQTPVPTTNTGSFQPQDPLSAILAVSVAVLLLGVALFFIKTGKLKTSYRGSPCKFVNKETV